MNAIMRNDERNAKENIPYFGKNIFRCNCGYEIFNLRFQAFAVSGHSQKYAHIFLFYLIQQ